MPQVNLSTMDPLAEARRVVDLLLPVAADSRRMEVFDAWEGYNEPVASDVEQMKRLADMEAERVRLLAAHGIRSVIGNTFGLPWNRLASTVAIWACTSTRHR